MSIKSLFVKSDDNNYATTFKRGFATSIDVWIVLVIRVIAMNILGALWISEQMLSLHDDFKSKFGDGATDKIPQEQIADFITNHPAFLDIIIFYLIIIIIGSLYYAYMNSSSWNATIGKRIAGIMIIKENELPLSFKRGLLHYFLSVLPFAFVIYLVSYKIRYQLNFYDAIVTNNFNLMIGVIFVLWVQVSLFTKKKSTAYDLICKTITINGRTKAKWPWTKIQAN